MAASIGTDSDSTQINGETDSSNNANPEVNDVDPKPAVDEPTASAKVIDNNETPDEEVESAEALPSTPTKITPHKRSADQVRAGSFDPPRSPAAKKKKWEDYVQEHENKERRRRESPSPQPATNVTMRKKSNSLSYLGIAAVIIAVIAVAVGGILSYYNYSRKPSLVANKPRYSWKKANSNFYNWTRTLEQEFPKQNKETWIQLIASISSTLDKTEPVHPAAITALFPPSMDDAFAACFLRKVGRIVNKAVSPLLGNDDIPAEVMELTPSTFKTTSITQIRANLDAYFKTEGKALLNLNLDEVQSEEHLLLFHGLCDNFRAVDKRATLLFPIRVPQEIFSQYEWIHARGGDIVNTVLSQMWKGKLSADTGPAMVARVADSVILLKEGDTCS